MSELEPASRGEGWNLSHSQLDALCMYLLKDLFIYKIVCKRDIWFNVNCLICQTECYTVRGEAAMQKG